MRPHCFLHLSSALNQLAMAAAVPLVLAPAAVQAQYAQPQYPQSQYPQTQEIQPQQAPPQYAKPSPYGYGVPSVPAQQFGPQLQYGQQSYPDQQYGAQGNDQQTYDQPPPAQIYDQGNAQQGPLQQPLSAATLEQMVAPIALYPDALVAQILAAATYPAQVVGADHWLQAQGYASADQIAYGANQQSWDPSVKGLTAFPQVLAQMDHDIQWTTDLGNAYYNQPQDVLQTIQVLRQRAEGAGTLQSTPQEAVTTDQGYIQVAPVNPQVVYVPAYNPWNVYGQPIQPYPGFSLLGSLASFAGSGPVRFGLGIAMSAFSSTPFGWAGWALNWLASAIFFHQSNYVSHSATVAHWGNYPHGGLPTRTPRGFEAGNRSFGGGYNGEARPATEFARSRAYGGRGYSGYRPSDAPNRGYQQFGNSVRPAVQNNFAYSRPQPSMTAREQAYARPGYSYQGGYGQSFAGRPSKAYASPQRNEFAQRSYQPQRDYSGYGGSGYGNRAFAEARPQTGGTHFRGGGAERSSGYKAPRSSFKEPKFKAPKEHGGGHSGGGHSGGGHGHRL